MSIVVDNIAFSYDNSEVLKGINFIIPEGEIWALLGRSGIGKTTLLQVIAGLFKPSEGQVVINGAIASPGLIQGIVFQDDSLLDWLTVRDNLNFPKNSNSDQEKEKADNMLSAVGLYSHADRYPFELSAGMKKRLEFARALMVDNQYILADEPFGTVDAVTRRTLWRLWSKFRQEEPRTGILCTHDPEEAIRLCDVIVTLKANPTENMADVIKIPESVRSLSMDREEKEFWVLKNKIIQSLEDS